MAKKASRRTSKGKKASTAKRAASGSRAGKAKKAARRGGASTAKRKAVRSTGKKSTTRSAASKRVSSSKRTGNRAGGKGKSAARSMRPKTAATSPAVGTTDPYARMGTPGIGGFEAALPPSGSRPTDEGSTYALEEPLGKASAQQPEYEEIEEEDEFESEETGGV